MEKLTTFQRVQAICEIEDGRLTGVAVFPLADIVEILNRLDKAEENSGAADAWRRLANSRSPEIAGLRDDVDYWRRESMGRS